MEEGVPGHKAYPSPKASASTISPSALLQWMLDGKIAGKDFVLVDPHRNDHESGTVEESLNLPTHAVESVLCSGNEACGLVLL